MILSQECRYYESDYRLFNAAQQLWCRTKQFAHRLQQWGKILDQRRQLLSMNDRMLKDIGISRADAVRLARSPGFLEFMLQKTPEAPQDKRMG